MTPEDRALLAEEATAIHAQFFGGAMPRKVAERYVAAHEQWGAEPDERARRLMRVVLDRALDIEAVELALRARRGDRTLTRKVQVLFYLVEVRSAYYAHFVNTRPGHWRAWLHLFAALLRTAAKFLKGSWQVRRYGL